MFWVFPARGDHILSHKPACSEATQLENHEHQTLVSDPYDNRIILSKYKAVRRFSFLQNLQIEQSNYKQIKSRKVSRHKWADNCPCIPCFLCLALSTISEMWQNHWSLKSALPCNRNHCKVLEGLKITGDPWTVWLLPYDWDGCNDSFI